MTLRSRVFLFVPMCFLLLQADAQPRIYSTFHDTVTFTAHPNLKANGFHRFLFGSLWRDVWATPVSADILFLDSLADTETIDTIMVDAYERNFTRLYHFKDKDKLEYSFTPLKQDSVSSLPSELSVLLPREVVDDQMGTLNPYALLISAPLLRAVGLPYRETRLAALVIQSNKPSLGILEGPWVAPYLGKNFSADSLIDTETMLQSLARNNQSQVDELQYLKARLLDIFLGDWDRSANQWRWIKVKERSQIVWRPVPAAHVQAFVRLNGVLPTVADLAIPQLEHCGENISSITNLTLAARPLDRRLLISYPKQTWDSLASWIKVKITDSVIQHAVAQLPIPIFEKEGEALAHMLQERRAQVSKAAEEFYKLSSEYVDLDGTENADQVEIRRIGRHMVSISVYDRNDTSHLPLFQRLFHDDVTKEVRLLLRDGDDSATLEGEESSTIKIIVDGGTGKNELMDKTKSRSLFSSMNPFSAAGTVFYDSNPESRIKTGSNSQVIRDRADDQATGTGYLNEKIFRDWGSEWSLSPWLDLNPDDGLFIGGGPIYTKYGFRMNPYAQQISVRAGLATKTGRYRFDAIGEFRDWFRGIRAIIQLHASQLDLSNFFGHGNETTYSQSLDNAGYYKVDQRQIFLYTALGFQITKNTSAAIGGTLKLIDNNPKPGTLLDTLRLPYYKNSLTFVNVTARVNIDTRDVQSLPTRGMYANAEISYLPGLFDNANSFYKLKGDLQSYFNLHTKRPATLALRINGEKMWGAHPFFESAFLGGNESLRGFERQRFAGDASVFGSAELRAQVMQIPFIVPLWAGVSGFAETGRVFLDGEQSNRWHTVLGGGIWFSFIKPEYIASFSLARSEDKFAFYVTMGFMF